VAKDIRDEEVKDTRDEEISPREASGSNQRQPKEKAKYPVASKTIGSGLPKHIEAHIIPHLSQMGSHGATGYNVCPAGFQPHFGPILPCYSPVPPFGKGNVYTMLLYLRSL
jgi:hypothetical protein